MTEATGPGVLRVALVGCGASKLTRAAPARSLYTGDLFRKASAWAQTHSDRWYVLSARHYLVHPDCVLAPYEQRMPTQKDSAVGWARVVDSKLRCSDASLAGSSFHGQGHPPEAVGLGAWVMAGGSVEITVLAGVDYCRHLVPLLTEWADVIRPLAGMGIGHQKAALARGLPGVG